MKFQAKQGGVTEIETDALVVNLYQGVKEPGGATGAIDEALDGQIRGLIDDGEIKGKAGEITLIHTGGRLPAKRVVVVGLGKKDDADLETMRRAMGSATRRLLKHGITGFHTILHGGGDLEETGVDVPALAQAIAEGAGLAGYVFDRFKTVDPDAEPGEKKEREKKSLESLTVIDIDGEKVKAVEKGLDRGAKIVEAVNYTRDLGNSPPNEMTPAALAERAVSLAEEHGMEVEVLDEEDLRDRKMGGILGVGQGSSNGPRLVVLRYAGGDEGEKPFIVAGKAVTFDTGGISIKPSSNMQEMKFDKMGGCAVLGIMKAVASLGLERNVIGVVPSAENMPSGTAYRPGDILTSYSGKTIEIINTDAEGRLILADALAWACEQEPAGVIDLATLTGSCVVALGHYASGAFGDERIVDALHEIGDGAGDRAWPLPLYDEFGDDMKSDIADIKNSGGRWGGASTAAAFLKFFVEDDVPWAHLDIAGTAWVTKAKGYNPVGATGSGVRLVTEYLSAR